MVIVGLAEGIAIYGLIVVDHPDRQGVSVGGSPCSASERGWRAGPRPAPWCQRRRRAGGGPAAWAASTVRRRRAAADPHRGRGLRRSRRGPTRRRSRRHRPLLAVLPHERRSGDRLQRTRAGATGAAGARAQRRRRLLARAEADAEDMLARAPNGGRHRVDEARARGEQRGGGPPGDRAGTPPARRPRRRARGAAVRLRTAARAAAALSRPRCTAPGRARITERMPRPSRAVLGPDAALLTGDRRRHHRAHGGDASPTVRSPCSPTGAVGLLGPEVEWLWRAVTGPRRPSPDRADQRPAGRDRRAGAWPCTTSSRWGRRATGRGRRRSGRAWHRPGLRVHRRSGAR